MGKRELVALLSLASRCPVVVVWLFLMVLWVCLQFVIVVFPDHTPLLFFYRCLAPEINTLKNRLGCQRQKRLLPIKHHPNVMYHICFI